MKYTVYVGEKCFDNVSKRKISSSWRSESSTKNLGGDLLIDRTGSEKTDITITIGGLAEEDVEFLRKERAKISTEVKYFMGSTLVIKNMYLKPFSEPAPIYFFGDINKGMIYPNITLTFTEV